jgi:hypothetical protein
MEATEKQKLDLTLTLIRKVVGCKEAKRKKMAYYKESFELGRFKNISWEKICSFDFEKEVRDYQMKLDGMIRNDWK